VATLARDLNLFVSCVRTGISAIRLTGRNAKCAHIHVVVTVRFATRFALADEEFRQELERLCSTLAPLLPLVGRVATDSISRVISGWSFRPNFAKPFRRLFQVWRGIGPVLEAQHKNL
jgi:hypothetical protein